MNWNEDLRKLVEKKFSEEWDLTPMTSVDFGENLEFKEPKGGDPWCRITINIISSSNAEIGTRFQRYYGIINVQCFTKKYSGESFNNSMLGKVGDIFQNKNFEGLHCLTMTPLKIGTVENWFQQNAKVDFYYNVFS